MVSGCFVFGGKGKQHISSSLSQLKVIQLFKKTGSITDGLCRTGNSGCHKTGDHKHCDLEHDGTMYIYRSNLYLQRKILLIKILLCIQIKY